MRPIKLIISAFGSYADKTPEINFEQFEEKGLFLVSGDTGAGKTTIFDAICFALYGTTSGSYRDTKNLRSEYAAADTKSFVDFYFSHQGKEYRVYRQPQYERPLKRGTGTKTEPETAVFQCGSQTPVEGVKAVNMEIHALLHIDAAQFKQIAMIAQGEFWELLNAKTEKRTEILRTIFMTESYKKIEYLLKDRMDLGVGGLKDTEKSIVQYFRDVTAGEESRFGGELTQMQERAGGSGSAWNLKEMLETIAGIIQEDEAQQNLLTESLKKEAEILEDKSRAVDTAETNNKLVIRLEDLTKERDELSARGEVMAARSDALRRKKDAVYFVNPVHSSWKAKIKSIADTEKAIQDKEAERDQAIQEDENAGQVLKGISAQEARAEEMKQLAARIDRDLEKYSLRDQLQEEIASLQEAAGRFRTRGKELEQAEKSLKEKIADLHSKMTRLQNCPLELAEAKAAEEREESLQADIDRIMNTDIPAFEQKAKEFGKKQKQFIKIREDYEAAGERRKQAETMLENCRAGILAGKLEEGKPCPVCGSTHHPMPASFPAESISEEQYQEYVDQEETAQHKKDDALRAAEGAKATVEALEKQLRESAERCIGSDFRKALPDEKAPGKIIELKGMIAEKQAELENRRKENKKRIDELNQSCEELEKARRSYEKALGEESEELNANKEKLIEEKHNNENSLTEKEASLLPLKELPYENMETAQKVRNDAEAEARGITAAMEAARKKKEETGKKVVRMDSAVKTMKDTLEKEEAEEERLCREFQSALKSKRFLDENEFLAYVVSEKELLADEKELSDYDTAVKTNGARLQQAEADACGKTMVNLEAVRTERDEQKNRVDDLRQQQNAVSSRLIENRKRQKSIIGLQEKLERCRREANTARRLYELVRGTTGKGKITLEQYIQATGFERIIQAANCRLAPMSDGQYELYRKGSSGKQSNTWLDLEVLDNFTGHRRPVGNLSGGESFKASLSLALGLSDTVSSQMGGVSMEALFVDEGFGTLDRKSMENAMDILLHLSGTGKLVGIISHREELKENIMQQIRVSKTQNGSRITVDLGT